MAGSAEARSGECASRAAQLAHRGGGLDPSPDDVADHEPDAVAGERERVVPVAADLERLYRRPVVAPRRRRGSSSGTPCSRLRCSTCAISAICCWSCSAPRSRARAAAARARSPGGRWRRRRPCASAAARSSASSLQHRVDEHRQPAAVGARRSRTRSPCTRALHRAAAARSASRGRSGRRRSAGPRSVALPTQVLAARSRSSRGTSRLTLTIVPSGQRRQIAARRLLVEVLGASSVAGRARRSRHRSQQEGLDRGDRLLGRAEVRAMPGRVEQHEPAAGDRAVHVLADRARGDHVLARTAARASGRAPPARSARLSDEERHPGELAGDLRVGAAEAVRQLLPELGPVGVAHDHRGHRARPAEVVAVERVEQLVDVGLAEPADVARRRRCSAATGRPARACRTAPARRWRRARRSSR